MSRLVIVTGGAKGIGLEVVSRFVALGDDVIALGRDATALAALEGARGIVCDISSETEVAAVLDDLPVDVLVNNAGISEAAPLHRTTLESWNRQLAVNATGAFLCTRAVIGGMRRRGRGAIITVASTAGRVGAPYTAAYTASKHAAVGLMRAAASELAGTGVTANAVCPTFVDTEMTERSVERIVASTGRSAQDSVQALADTSPLGRLLTAAEVAASVVWLASPEAASINGQTLILDGGGVQA
ncbi:MAG: short-chain dehydrogenase/reductase [Solirubrobacterales bacterium]|nr:short-chain dehydrogenase/reductase [Solirubrobacterales bacterium]